MRPFRVVFLLLAAAPAFAQNARFEWLARIDEVLPAIDACASAHPAQPVGVVALRADGHMLLRDASALVWSCELVDGRAKLSVEPDPSGEPTRRPLFWPARYGEPWAECWDAEPAHGRDGRLVGWYVVQNC